MARTPNPVLKQVAPHLSRVLCFQFSGASDGQVADSLSDMSGHAAGWGPGRTSAGLKQIVTSLLTMVFLLLGPES